MSGIAKIVGGAAGFALGGPTGAAIGSSLGGLVGGGDDASERAARVQQQEIGAAIDKQDQALEVVREKLTPFFEEGKTAITGLGSLVSDPQDQADFISDNPFFELMADRARGDLLSNQAARGKVGSGDTAEALQNSLMLIGSDILRQNIAERQGLGGLGLNAATNLSQFTQTGASNIGNLLTSRGAVSAAGIMGASEAQTAREQNLLNTLGEIGGSESGQDSPLSKIFRI